jgi:hypothetical protein
MHLARGLVAVDLGLECVAKLARRGAEGDECAASGNGVDLKSLSFEPVPHPVHIVRGEPKPTTEFFRREPLVISRRGGILLIGDQTRERRGLGYGRLEMQLYAMYPMVLRQRPAVLRGREAGISGAKRDRAMAFQTSPQTVLRLRHCDRFKQE